MAASPIRWNTNVGGIPSREGMHFRVLAKDGSSITEFVYVVAKDGEGHHILSTDGTPEGELPLQLVIAWRSEPMTSPEPDLPLTPLEAEVADLRRRIDVLAERARIDAHAAAFLQGSHPVREGDCCLIDDRPTRFLIHPPGQRSQELLRVPSSDGIRRLYTIEEVAEIVAKVRQEAPWQPSAEDVTALVKGLDVAIYGHEEVRTSTEDEGRWKVLRDQLVGLVSGKEWKP